MDGIRQISSLRQQENNGMKAAIKKWEICIYKRNI